MIDDTSADALEPDKFFFDDEVARVDEHNFDEHDVKFGFEKENYDYVLAVFDEANEISAVQQKVNVYIKVVSLNSTDEAPVEVPDKDP